MSAVLPCVQTIAWLPMLGIFNMFTDVNACNSAWQWYEHYERVRTEESTCISNLPEPTLNQLTYIPHPHPCFHTTKHDFFFCNTSHTTAKETIILLGHMQHAQQDQSIHFITEARNKKQGRFTVSLHLRIVLNINNEACMCGYHYAWVSPYMHAVQAVSLSHSTYTTTSFS